MYYLIFNKKTCEKLCSNGGIYKKNSAKITEFFLVWRFLTIIYCGDCL